MSEPARTVTSLRDSQSMRQRIEHLEVQMDMLREAAQVIVTLAPVFKTATKLFKTYAPMGVVLLLTNLGVNPDVQEFFRQVVSTAVQ